MTLQEQARALHQTHFVFDGLTYLCDGTTTNLMAGGVNATNITVPAFEDDWAEACQKIAVWLARCRSSASPWVLIESVDDFERTETQGTIGIVMGWQNMRPIGDSLERIEHGMGAVDSMLQDDDARQLLAESAHVWMPAIGVRPDAPDVD